MLSDSDKMKDLPATKPRAVHAKTALRWSDSQKIEAATTFLALGGNTVKTSLMLKIPEATLIQWKRTEWWQDLIKDLKTQENLVVSTKLKAMIDKSLEAINDRIESGDFVWDQKAQKLVRKPLAAKDLNKIVSDFIDRRQVLDTTENVKIAEENIAAKLEKLAKSFEDFASKQDNKPHVIVTDVIFGEETVSEGDRFSEGENNAVYEEREEGLQEGEPGVQLSPGTEESPQ